MYTIRRTETKPALEGNWGGPVWRQAETLEIRRFHPRSSDHRPRTLARLLHDGRALYVHFRVEDRYVRSVNTEYQSNVCHDSCVEFFVRPKQHLGYFNFEVNAGGTLLCSFVEDWTRTNDGFAKCEPLPAELGEQVRIWHSLPKRVEPELAEETTWQIEYALPATVLEPYVGALDDLGGQRWHANLYKCGDRTSHPHWATWAPIGEVCNFHMPEYFAPLILA